MKSLAEKKKQIRKFVLEKLAGPKEINLHDQDNLIESGIIDSLGIMQLVTYIESAYVIKVRDEDIVPENFESIDLISSYIEAATADGGANA